MSQSLNGQVVLITGASSGFGADAARLFAKEGCAVVLAARRIDRLQDLAEKIQSEGGSALAVPVDIAERRSIYGMMETVFDIYDHVDILFNNAGFGRLNWLESLNPPRDIQTQVAVNLLGTIEVTRIVLPHMLKRGKGHIINMSSIAGYIGAPTYAVYAATKFGLRGFTESLRREVGPRGIKVSGIYPGPAATEFGKRTPTDKPGTPHGGALPTWFTMKSEYVAAQVVKVAKHPRRSVIVPWWLGPIIWTNETFPALTDWFINTLFTRRYQPTPPPPNPDEKKTIV